MAAFGLAHGCLGTIVRGNAEMLAPLPPGVEHSEAATLPTVATTVDVALREVAATRPGERVLLHATTGGVGLAGLQVAAALGCTPLGTAGSTAKRGLLRSLGVGAVAGSRDTCFASDLALATHGAGADVVLNSLTSPGMVGGALALLRRGGRLVEIGKRDVWSGAAVAAQRPDVAYHFVAVDFLPPAHLGRQMARLSVFLAASAAVPLRAAAYPLHAAAAAMRLLAQASHVGKILALAPPTPLLPAAGPAARGRVVITGGGGGLGVLMARWLVVTGAAARITLVTRGGRLAGAGGDGAAAAGGLSLGGLLAAGAEVTVLAADVAAGADAGELWRQLDGRCDVLLHAAGVLQVSAAAAGLAGGLALGVLHAGCRQLVPQASNPSRACDCLAPLQQGRLASSTTLMTHHHAAATRPNPHPARTPCCRTKRFGACGLSLPPSSVLAPRAAPLASCPPPHRGCR
jgi:NADPH:quinone reductase-like Zn-dependent oxidoreductase